MNPMVVMSAVFATAAAAPTYGGVATNGVIAAPAAVGYAGVAAAPVGIATGLGYAGVAAAPAAINVPAPYTTAEVRGADVISHSQAPAVVSKQLHYGSKDFVSGHTSEILKPAIPDFRIAVPTALKGTQSITAPIVKTVKETHVVNEPVPVEKRYNVPYDVPVYKEQIREIPVPVHVDKPYGVAVPTPIQGEPIVNVRQGPALVKHTHTNVGIQQVAQVAAVAQPAVAAVGYANVGAYGAEIAAAPAVGYGINAASTLGYGINAAPAATLGYSGVAAAPAVAAYGAEIATAPIGYGINAAHAVASY